MERYYQPEIECASREQILAWQNERLVKQVRHVWDSVPYYRHKMEEKGLTPHGCADQIRKALDIYSLPHECGLPLSALTEAVTLDKKNLNGRLNLVLLHGIGESYVQPADVGFFEGTRNV